MFRPQTLNILGCIAVLTAFGCGSDPRTVTGPQSQRAAGALPSAHQPNNGSRAFYPLEIGNRWSYRGTSLGYFGPRSGESTAVSSSFSRSTTLTGTRVLLGKAFTSEQRVTDWGYETTNAVRWLRQDPTGLYRYEEPFSPFPPPLPPIEVRLLAYPLHRGATWIADEVRHARATVEAREVIDTPAGRFPAWRIRIDYPQPPALTEYDVVWYGDVGYLGGRYEFRSKDPNRDFIVVLHTEEWLESVTLGTPASRTGIRSSARPGSPREVPPN